MKPFFTVIIPTYNNADIIGDTINSVLNQTFSDFELIIIDDGSTDNTKEKVLSYKDDRITYTKIENFGGPSKPRNIGISISRSDWICFLDSDDTWNSDKLEVCHKYINPETDFIYHKVKVVGSYFLNTSRYMGTKELNKPILKDLLLKGNCIVNSSVVVRKSILNKVNNINESRKMIATEDFNTWLKISRITQKFIYIPLVLGNYLVDGNGISKRDVYHPYREATMEFVKFLDKDESLIFNLNLERLELKNKIINGSIDLLDLPFIKFIINKKFSFLMKLSLIWFLVWKERVMRESFKK